MFLHIATCIFYILFSILIAYLFDIFLHIAKCMLCILFSIIIAYLSAYFLHIAICIYLHIVWHIYVLLRIIIVHCHY